MVNEGFNRKLTTIFSADAAGYSRLMGNDEAATVKTLSVYRNILVDLISQHRGRVIDSPGDNLLAEFGSVVDSVQCAVAVQKELEARNSELPEDRKMQFRIGINLGDVIQDGKRIYGDGVNIAARLEGLADPGGICISKTVFDHIERKLPLGYEYLGGQQVKNISKPIEAYKVLMEARVETKDMRSKKSIARNAITRKLAFGVAAVFLAAVGAIVVWQFSIPEPTPPAEKVDLGSAVYPPSDKPSIAVMPFENLTGDPQQQYYSEGMSEQIITGLSQGPYLYVTARTSSFAFRDKAMTAQQIAEELGVRYLLEGSVQRDTDRVRVNVQLIDGRNGNHIWAEYYDRRSEDLFALQDEITMEIMNTLNIQITGFKTGGKYLRPSNLQAYEYYLKGLYYHLGRKRQDIVPALQAIEQAIHLEPNFTAAYNLLGFIYLDKIVFRLAESSKEVFDKAEQAAQKAFELDPDNPPYTLWCHFYRLKKDYAQAVSYGEKCVKQAPNQPYRYYFLSTAQFFDERFEDANTSVNTALNLAPFRPVNFLQHYGWTFVGMKQYEEAIPIFTEVVERSPKSFYAYLSYKGLIAAYEEGGNHDKAQWAAKNLMQMNPKYSLAKDYEESGAKNGVFKETLFNAYRRAGLK